jgi:hypothetical protein
LLSLFGSARSSGPNTVADAVTGTPLTLKLSGGLFGLIRHNNMLLVGDVAEVVGAEVAKGLGLVDVGMAPFGVVG